MGIIGVSVLSELSDIKVKETCFINKKTDVFTATKYLNCTISLNKLQMRNLVKSFIILLEKFVQESEKKH